MIKPKSLRAALTAAVPHLQINPQDLHIFLEEGSLRSTMSGGLSSEYAYTLNAIITNYADEADALFIPVMAWLRWQQPEMLLNRELMKEGFTFEVDFISHEQCDISIKLKLTERVIVTQELALTPEGEKIDLPENLTPDSTLPGPGTIATITHKPEPIVEPYRFIERWTMFIAGEKVREWDTKPFDGPVTPGRPG